MRMFGLTFACLLFLIQLVAGQQAEDNDPYSTDLVAYELGINTNSQRVVHSWSQKRLVQMGDAVSIALLKVLTPDDLGNASKVRDALPIIRNAFSQPELIGIKSDRYPRVTNFLLGTLKQRIADQQIQSEIQMTLDYVREKSKE